jgi:hypothetical protein
MNRESATLFESMDPMDALNLYSETDVSYRITWECPDGRGEAAERMKRSGRGEVTPDGEYVRVVPHE